jgi:hypothetical protein
MIDFYLYTDMVVGILTSFGKSEAIAHSTQHRKLVAYYLSVRKYCFELCLKK